jgi:hypothetical protein
MKNIDIKFYHCVEIEVESEARDKLKQVRSPIRRILLERVGRFCRLFARQIKHYETTSFDHTIANFGSGQSRQLFRNMAQYEHVSRPGRVGVRDDGLARAERHLEVCCR